MTDRQVRRWSDADLIDGLRAIGPEVAWPRAAPAGGTRDLAATVRERIEALPSPVTELARPGARRALPMPGWLARPPARAALIAVVLLIALAAIAGAAGIELPGLRIFLGDNAVSPPPSVEPSRSASPAGPGAAMRLGHPVSLADRVALDSQAGFHVRWPGDPVAGPPVAGYLDQTRQGQVSLVWSARADLPATLEPGVGLVLTEFLGSVDPAYYGKAVGIGTTVEPVVVGGRPGYWLSGDPHFFFYVGPGGVVQDDRRWVGDALIWSDGEVTYRLESGLGRDATIRIAESLD